MNLMATGSVSPSRGIGRGCLRASPRDEVRRTWEALHTTINVLEGLLAYERASGGSTESSPFQICIFVSGVTALPWGHAHKPSSNLFEALFRA